MTYHLTREALRLDLMAAHQCAKRHKASRPYVLHFERRLEEEIERLCDDLWQRRYQPEPSTCFIVEHPKKREVFAAQYRDRVVHHLYFNYCHCLFERTFISDCYACIEQRGTHYGQHRLQRHIRQETQGYQLPCYVMKLDLRGYFMHINRQRLLQIATRSLRRMASHRLGSAAISYGLHPQDTWADAVDMDFVEWLTQEIAMLDPKDHCRIAGSLADWEGLDYSKSLFHTADGCGLPIGNLTSQLLSNVYLNEFDQFMKRTLGCRHYGRYVDDSFVVSTDREWLLSLVPQIRQFLADELQLDLHMGKLHVTDARYGVEFLGGYVKARTVYISTASLRRMERKVRETCAAISTAVHRRGMVSPEHAETVSRSLNSFLGVLCHYDSFRVRSRLLLVPSLLAIGRFNAGITRFVIHSPVCYCTTAASR